MCDGNQRLLRGRGVGIHQVHDRALMRAGDAGVRIGHEVAHIGGMPVVASRQARLIVEPLLHNRPLAVGRDDERVQVNLKSVGDAVVVDLGGEAAGTDQRVAIQAPALRDGAQFVRRVARMPPASAADVQSEFRRTRIEPPLERADHRRGDAGRVPVHPHDGPESLKPIRIAEPRKKRRMTVVEKNTLDDRRPKLRHPVGEPGRHTAAVQRQVRNSRTLHTSIVSGNTGESTSVTRT